MLGGGWVTVLSKECWKTRTLVVMVAVVGALLALSASSPALAASSGLTPDESFRLEFVGRVNIVLADNSAVNKLLKTDPDSLVEWVKVKVFGRKHVLQVRAERLTRNAKAARKALLAETPTGVSEKRARTAAVRAMTLVIRKGKNLQRYWRLVASLEHSLFTEEPLFDPDGGSFGAFESVFIWTGLVEDYPPVELRARRALATALKASDKAKAALQKANKLLGKPIRGKKAKRLKNADLKSVRTKNPLCNELDPADGAKPNRSLQTSICFVKQRDPGGGFPWLFAGTHNYHGEQDGTQTARVVCDRGGLPFKAEFREDGKVTLSFEQVPNYDFTTGGCGGGFSGSRVITENYVLKTDAKTGEESATISSNASGLIPNALKFSRGPGATISGSLTETGTQFNSTVTFTIGATCSTSCPPSSD
jgi:hypothetical protein